MEQHLEWIRQPEAVKWPLRSSNGIQRATMDCWWRVPRGCKTCSHSSTADRLLGGVTCGLGGGGVYTLAVSNPHPAAQLATTTSGPVTAPRQMRRKNNKLMQYGGGGGGGGKQGMQYGKGNGMNGISLDHSPKGLRMAATRSSTCRV